MKTPKQQTLADTFKRKENSSLEDQGSLGHLEFLNPWYVLPSRHNITLTPLLSYNMPVCTLVSWVSHIGACKTGNWGDVENVWNRQATWPRHFTRQHKEYIKSSGWYGGAKCGLRLTHTPADCTQGTAVTAQRHRLTSWRWSANVAIAYAE